MYKNIKKNDFLHYYSYDGKLYKNKKLELVLNVTFDLIDVKLTLSQ